MCFQQVRREIGKPEDGKVVSREGWARRERLGGRCGRGKGGEEGE